MRHWEGRRRPQDGFTLVELMVVVLIMAILLAIAIPTYLGARHSADDHAAQASLDNALGTAQGYWNSHQTYSGLTAAGMAAREPNLNFASPSTGANSVAFTPGSGGYSISMSAMSASGTCWYVADVEDTSSAWIGTTGIPHPRTYYGSTPGASSCASLANGQTPQSGWLSSFYGSKVSGTAPAYPVPQVTWNMPSGTIYQGSNDTVNWSFTPPTTGAYRGWNQGWDGGNPSGPTFQTTTGQLPVSGLSAGTHNVTLEFFFNGQSQQVSSPSVTVVAATPYDQYVNGLGPLAYYRFLESAASQPAADSSGNGNNATYHGSVTPGQPGPFSGAQSVSIPSSPNSQACAGCGFTSSTANYVETPLQTQMSTTALTIEGWIQPAPAFTQDNGRIWASSWGSKGPGVEMVLNGNRTWQSSVDPFGSVPYFQRPAVAQPGTWYFVAMSVSVNNGATTYVTYIDNLEPQISTISAPMGSPTYPLALGVNPAYWGDNLIGSLSDVAIFNKVLTGAQIQKQYQLAVAQGA